MQPIPALTCPKCGAAVRVAPLGFPPTDELSGEAAGTVLKQCPRCRAWSWMTLQPQEAT
jgi:ribosomal protein S27AE